MMLSRFHPGDRVRSTGQIGIVMQWFENGHAFCASCAGSHNAQGKPAVRLVPQP